MDASAAKLSKPASATPKAQSKFLKGFRENFPFVLMMLPGLFVLLINNYLPMFGVIMAFEQYRFKDNFIVSLLSSKFVGFDNFKFLFASPSIFEATRNTILYNLGFIALDIIIPVAMAIGLTELWRVKLSKFFQSAIFLPYFLSWVVVSYLAYSLFSFDNGFINRFILAPMGIQSINWYTELAAWPFILVFFHLWKYTGYNLVVYMATISGISDEYYEAATLDGATKWQQTKYITLPMLKTIVIITTLLSVGRIFNADFGLFFNVPRNSGALYKVTNVIDTMVYMQMRNSANVSMTAAAGLYQAVVGCITVFTANFIVRKIDSDSALF
jgi:putative aldouronate transport system permease protein